MPKSIVRRIGTGLGITIPSVIVEKYHLAEGDDLHLVETEEGILLTPFDPKFSDWTAAYRQADKKYRKILRDLAT